MAITLFKALLLDESSVKGARWSQRDNGLMGRFGCDSCLEGAPGLGGSCGAKFLPKAQEEEDGERRELRPTVGPSVEKGSEWAPPEAVAAPRRGSRLLASFPQFLTAAQGMDARFASLAARREHRVESGCPWRAAGRLCIDRSATLFP